MKKTLLRLTARVLLLSLGYQLVFPVYALALTSGPSQPEVQSFEPVGTTDMVDMFTGDYNYNIPLMDVEGFPINIAYHGGLSVEQEASWVGLGWNINPGEINRSVRGLPDDFDGETIEKTLNIQDEENFRVGMGVSASLEALGFNSKQYGLNVSLSFGSYIAYNNYRGMSAGFNTGATLSTPIASAGIDMGIGSQTGADIDVNAGFHLSEPRGSDVTASVGVSGGTGFNSRTGLKAFSWGVNASVDHSYGRNAKGQIIRDPKNSGEVAKKKYSSTVASAALSGSSVPVITNASVQKTFQFQARFGGEAFYVFPNAQLSIMKSTLHFESDGSKAGYGYMYAEDATDESIMDFSREKDGYYNNTLKNLPLSSMTYDVYSVSGQGTGGTFRPFRNDIGTIQDPLIAPPASKGKDVKLEGGLGNLFEVGTDVTLYENESKSGPWIKMPFRGKAINTLYEKLYFKQAGELTYNNQQATTALFNNDVQYVNEDGSSLSNKYHGAAGSMPAKLDNSYVYTGSSLDRTTRSNLLTFITGEDADKKDVAQSQKIVQFKTNGTDPFSNPLASETNRYDTAANKAKKKHITEFTQTLADGRRYIYGIPAMNNISKEVSFSVASSNANLNTGQVAIGTVSGNRDDTKANGQTNEHFYSHTATPAYAYSYLLTSVLSNDYVDVLGDGPTDDDLGSFTKINYTKWDDDYRWRAPYSKDSAQYNPGYWSDPNDDKGDYLMGSKEIWHIRSIETKNYVAEFYVSERNDGKGLKDSILPNDSKLRSGGLYSGTKPGGADSKSYKLDSIKLYNKHDRYINETPNTAVPIKTVIFRYSYRLCKGIPNTSQAITDDLTGGKLTLERIYIRYGNSDKNMLSPYVFGYGTNPYYNFACKDRWGTYKVPESNISNFEYPYLKQDATDIDVNAGAWGLTDIKLPSGGNIHVDYESDDYSYVQGRRAMQMFRISGVGADSNKANKANLYENVDQVNNYVYFKRNITAENTSRSMQDNYLEGATLMYYSFNLDISGTGKYEHIKGYATIEKVGICTNDANYGYVRLKKERAGKKTVKYLHPATIYGLNIGRFYIPHVLYPGFSEGGSGALQIMHGLRAAAKELFSIAEDPIIRFVDQDKKAKNIIIDKSWIRLNVPGLTKKGGGTRVKEIRLDDAWNTLTASGQNVNAAYGKHYDYTVWDPKWNRNISAGVASYEPMIGGDENPFRLPLPYTSEIGKLLPAAKFFQEEPFGESFFPPPVVGYSKVTVKSINAGVGRSAQSQETNEFYTAKDFPIEVDYADKEAPPPLKTKKFRKKSEVVTVKQGYTLKFNDMHGKLKNTTYYITNTDGANVVQEPVSSVTYKYNLDDKGRLSSVVKGVVRGRNTTNGYSVQSVRLGEEMDYTVDSRQRDNRSYSQNIDVNVNTVAFAVIIIPIPTAFFPDKEEKVTFKSLVSTKIIQRYGILKTVETYDHGAKIVSENMLYDAETGGVLLTKVNNEYNNDIYDLNVPAYWAYEGMGPAYTNVGYEESGATLSIEPASIAKTYYGNLAVSSLNKFSPGDELLVSYKVDDRSYDVKVWVLPAFSSVTSHYPSPYPINPSSANGKLRVVPRYLFKNTDFQFPELTLGSSVTGVTVKVLRSGRRNNLDKTVQHITATQNPYNANLNVLLGSDVTATAYNKILDVDVKQFSDRAFPYASDSALAMWGHITNDSQYYHPEMYPVTMVVGVDSLKTFNRYVLGHYGNYRVTTNYRFKDNRDYSANDIKTDGTFKLLNNLFWNYSSSGRTILSPASASVKWKKMSEITKYDVFGNAIEEMGPVALSFGDIGDPSGEDLSGKFSSAQYGYNKALPVAVANNINDNAFCFDGFEDYSMLIPEYLRSLYTNYHYHRSPIAPAYNEIKSGSNITRYRQNYIRLNLTPSNGDSITSSTSHTGLYSLRCAGARSFPIKVRNRVNPTYLESYFPNIRNFSFEYGKKYIISVWLKPTAGTPAAAATAAANTKITTPTPYPFQVKTGNIDGWYKAEVKFEPSGDVTSATLVLPTGAYIDDIRFIPVDATMKSFVYDPINFKLVAQLDENNFASFFEYDQEGMLVRVKKETDKGIMTISESRRANQKK